MGRIQDETSCIYGLPSAVHPSPSTVVGLLSGLEGVVGVHPLTSIFTQPPTAGWGRSDQNRMERTMQKGPQTVRASNGSIAVGCPSCTFVGDAKRKTPKPTTKIPPEGEAGRGMGSVNQTVSGGKMKKEMSSFPINQEEAPISPLPPFLQGVDVMRTWCRGTGMAYGESVMVLGYFFPGGSSS